VNQREMMLPQITLGWELEATHRASVHVPGVEVGHDGSVDGEGLEYRIRKEHVTNVAKSLGCLRAIATDPALTVNASCGFHVHLGLANRSRRLHDWAQWFVQLAREVETDAFKAVPPSRTDNAYCRSWRVNPESIGALQYHPSKHCNRDRYQWVNPVEVFRPGGIRTVEIRLMGATARYTWLLSWISVCRLMAMSSWALIFDASRLEKEKKNLQESFKLVRDSFILPDVPKKVAAKTAVFLASKAGLLEPFGKPLEKLQERERIMQYHAREESTDSRAWRNVLERMSQEFEAARSNARVYPPLPAHGYCVGDTVQVTSPTQDGGVEVGHRYRVTALNPDNSQPIGVIAPINNPWWVAANCVRLIDRVRS